MNTMKQKFLLSILCVLMPMPALHAAEKLAQLRGSGFMGYVQGFRDVALAVAAVATFAVTIKKLFFQHDAYRYQQVLSAQDMNPSAADIKLAQAESAGRAAVPLSESQTDLAAENASLRFQIAKRDQVVRYTNGLLRTWHRYFQPEAREGLPPGESVPTREGLQTLKQFQQQEILGQIGNVVVRNRPAQGLPAATTQKQQQRLAEIAALQASLPISVAIKSAGQRQEPHETKKH